MALPNPLRKPRFLEGVRGTILLALLVAFLFDLALDPPHDPVQVLARAVAFAVAGGIQVLIGVFLGRRTWPKRGRRLAARIVRRAFRGEVKPLLILTDRPDARPHLGRRVFEVVGFAAGASVIVAATLPLLGLHVVNVYALAATLTLFTLWGAWLLVPYWLFARMGLRRVDPVLRLVEPVSRRYADRLRLSNGALLLLALGASVNLAFRAGSSGEEALVAGIRSIVGIVAGVFLVAASATAFYMQGEKALVKQFEEEVLRQGVRDGRAMSDGDFLPRLP